MNVLPGHACFLAPKYVATLSIVIHWCLFASTLERFLILKKRRPLKVSGSGTVEVSCDRAWVSAETKVPAGRQVTIERVVVCRTLRQKDAAFYQLIEEIHQRLLEKVAIMTNIKW